MATTNTTNTNTPPPAGKIDTVNPQNGAGRLLPKKEGDMFKSVMKLYESKQYKKAIKQADAILKRFPQHGETLAMKGLTINSMHPATKKDAAIDFVRKGIQNDMRYVHTYKQTYMHNKRTAWRRVPTNGECVQQYGVHN